MVPRGFVGVAIRNIMEKKMSYLGEFSELSIIALAWQPVTQCNSIAGPDFYEKCVFLPVLKSILL